MDIYLNGKYPIALPIDAVQLHKISPIGIICYKYRALSSRVFKSYSYFKINLFMKLIIM